MNYRKIYRENYGDIPSGYDVHHLDRNKENNNPDNLLALPKEIHQGYHKSLNAIEKYSPLYIAHDSDRYIETVREWTYYFWEVRKYYYRKQGANV